MKKRRAILFPFDVLWIRFDTRRRLVVEVYWLGVYLGLLLFSVDIRCPFLYRLFGGR